MSDILATVSDKIEILSDNQNLFKYPAFRMNRKAFNFAENRGMSDKKWRMSDIFRVVSDIFGIMSDILATMSDKNEILSDIEKTD